jgi:hypothetical protein
MAPTKKENKALVTGVNAPIAWTHLREKTGANTLVNFHSLFKTSQPTQKRVKEGISSADSADFKLRYGISGLRFCS